MKKTLLIATSALILYGCKKNGGTTTPPPNNTANCTLVAESTTLVANNASWGYEYDSKGNPTKIIKYNVYGQTVSTTDISPLGTTIVHDDTKLVTEYYYNTSQADIFNLLPSSSDVSITIGALEQRKYWNYTFFYDGKHRLTQVSEHTNPITTDYEWDLHIAYDDKDNVTELRYEFSTGPRDQITICRATAYDDKPTPFANIKAWKFLGSFAWDNYDPEPLFTALSAHNPLEFTMGSPTEPNAEHRTMTYTYNDNGMPLERVNTHNNRGNTFTWKQTYTYKCK